MFLCKILSAPLCDFHSHPSLAPTLCCRPIVRLNGAPLDGGPHDFTGSSCSSFHLLTLHLRIFTEALSDDDTVLWRTTYQEEGYARQNKYCNPSCCRMLFAPDARRHRGCGANNQFVSWR